MTITNTLKYMTDMISDTPEILLFQMRYDNIVYYRMKKANTIGLLYFIIQHFYK